MEFMGSPVFGSTKKDISSLVLPVVFAILVGSSIKFFYPTLEPHWYYPLMIVFFDTPHFFSGYWVMLTTPNKDAHIKRFIICTFIFYFVFYFLLSEFNAYAWIYTMHAHYAAWHFVRQQQAFYQLSMSGTHPTKLGAWINKWGMHASTWGVFFISLCGAEAFGWYTPNDMIVFPEYLKPTAEVVVGTLVVLYIVYHTMMAFRLKKFPLVGNLVWLCGLMIYGCRVTGPDFLAGPLIIIPHAMTYLYLLHRYAKAHGVKKWGITPAVGVWVGYGIGFAYQMFYFFPRIVSGENIMKNGWEISLILAIGTAHFMHDKLFWNSKNNPGWNAGVLGPSKVEPVMNLKAS